MSKTFANTFSDLLAILKKKLPADAGKCFFHRKTPGSLPIPITVSELRE